jgi:hypothetical protein
MRTITLIVGILPSLLLASSNTHAVIVDGQMHGTIAFHAETRGIGDSVFGMGQTQLLGQPFTVDFRYNTSLAPVLYSEYYSTNAGAAYRSSDPALDWLSMSITVNGFTHHISGNNRYSDIRDFYANEPINSGVFDYFQLTVEGNNNATYVDSYRRQFLDISLRLPNDQLSDITFPTSINWNQIDNAHNGYSFRINEFDFDTATNTLTYEKYVSFGLDVQQVQATIVPLPPAALLFSSSLLFSLLLIRKRPSAYKLA